MIDRAKMIPPLAMVAVLLTGTAVSGQMGPVRWTSFAEIEIGTPSITGAVWLECDAAETIVPIDRDGDTVYSAQELAQAGGALGSYLNRNFLVMWQGRIRPLDVQEIKPAKRLDGSGAFLKLAFKVKDHPPGVPVDILSRLLHELSPAAQCMALIRHEGQALAFVLGPRDYYRSHPDPSLKVAGSVFRPPEQRGRIAAAGKFYVEMLYAVPQGAFYLYFLDEDRYSPRAIGAKSLTATLEERRLRGQPSAGQERGRPKKGKVYLMAEPLTVDPQGYCSRFVAAAPEWTDVKRFSVDIDLGAGAEKCRAIFDFPAVTILAPEEAAKAARRYACSKLCLGVSSRDESAKCPRCGSGLVEVRGARVPGAGFIGRHGGPLAPFGPEGMRLEAQLTRGHEIRLYVTNEKLDLLKVGPLSGKVTLFALEQIDKPLAEATLSPAQDGAYLSARIDRPITLPARIRCRLDAHDGRGVRTAEFLLQVAVETQEPPSLLGGYTLICRKPTPRPSTCLACHAY